MYGPRPGCTIHYCACWLEDKRMIPFACSYALLSYLPDNMGILPETSRLDRTEFLGLYPNEK